MELVKKEELKLISQKELQDLILKWMATRGGPTTEDEIGFLIKCEETIRLNEALKSLILKNEATARWSEKENDYIIKNND